MANRVCIAVFAGALALGLADSALAEEGTAATQTQAPAADPVAQVTQTVDAAARQVVEPVAAAVDNAVRPTTAAVDTTVKSTVESVSQTAAPATQAMDTAVRTTVTRTRRDADRTLAPVRKAVDDTAAPLRKAVDDTARPLRETTERTVGAVTGAQQAQRTSGPATTAEPAAAPTHARPAESASAVARASSPRPASRVDDSTKTSRRDRTGAGERDRGAAAARQLTQRHRTAAPAIADPESPIAATTAGGPAGPASGASHPVARHGRDAGDTDTGFSGGPDLSVGGVAPSGSSAAGSAGGTGPMFLLVLIVSAFGVAQVLRRLRLVQVARPDDAFTLLLERPG